MTPLLLGVVDPSAAASSLVFWAAQSLAVGTIAALLTWLLASSVMRKARPGLLAAMWLVVLVKFVVPVGPQFNYSLSSLVAAIVPLHSIAAFAGASETCATGPNARDMTNDVLRRPPMLQDLPLIGDLMIVTTVGAGPQAVAGSPFPPKSTSNFAAKPTTIAWVAGLPWLSMLAVAYVAGLAIVTTVRVVAYRRFLARSRALPLAEPTLRDYVHSLCRESGLVRMPTVRFSAQWPTPFVYGLISPTLVISVRQYNGPAELRAVLLHEIAHLRRGDLLVRYLQWVVGTLLFFWPVVAWVNRRIDLAREQACDEWALRHSRLSAAAYARCLLRAARARRSGWSVYVPAAMAANASHVERRIDMIMNTSTGLRRGRFLGLLGGAALVVWGGFVLSGANAAMFRAVRPAQDAAQAATGDVLVESKVIVLNADGQPLDAQTVRGVPILSDLPIIENLFRSGGASGNMTSRVFVRRLDGAGGEPHDVTIRMSAQPSPEMLASFLAAHPTADANGDGALSAEEHDAYLIALALRAPAGVLAEYPDADANHDGVLSADEAAKLVTVGGPHRMSLPAINVVGHKLDDTDANAAGKPRMIKMIATNDMSGATCDKVDPAVIADAIAKAKAGGGSSVVCIKSATCNVDAKVSDDASAGMGDMKVKVDHDDANNALKIIVGDGEPVVVKLDADGGADQTIEEPGRKIVVRRIVSGSSNGPAGQSIDLTADQNVNVICTKASSDVDCADVSALIADRLELRTPMPPAFWLTRNVDAVPTADEVGQYVGLARTAPLADFLAANPTADANGDGVLTADERDAFIAKQGEEIRAHILQSMPDADLNGDGTLTEQEMHEFFMSKANAGGAMNVSGGKPRVMFFRSGSGMGGAVTTTADDGAGQHELIMKVHAVRNADGTVTTTTTDK